jgi:hypothetical protein
MTAGEAVAGGVHKLVYVWPGAMEDPLQYFVY